VQEESCPPHRRKDKKRPRKRSVCYIGNGLTNFRLEVLFEHLAKDNPFADLRDRPCHGDGELL
jgi:hypothetical protein